MSSGALMAGSVHWALARRDPDAPPGLTKVTETH
jgi:hypothetical protein